MLAQMNRTAQSADTANFASLRVSIGRAVACFILGTSILKFVVLIFCTASFYFRFDPISMAPARNA